MMKSNVYHLPRQAEVKGEVCPMERIKRAIARLVEKGWDGTVAVHTKAQAKEARAFLKQQIWQRFAGALQPSIKIQLVPDDEKEFRDPGTICR
jgi:DNA polymerase IIIc chi subunit